MTNLMKLAIVGLCCLGGCDFHIHEKTYATATCEYKYIYNEEYHNKYNSINPTGHPNYCSGVNEYGECICVVYIDRSDIECRQEFCFYWDTCRWEKYDAWCHY